LKNTLLISYLLASRQGGFSIRRGLLNLHPNDEENYPTGYCGYDIAERYR
jgi:hypothetical protein